MDGKTLLAALAVLGASAAVFATVLTAVVPDWSKQTLRYIFLGTGAIFALSLLWVVIAFKRTPDVSAAVKKSLEATINLTENAKFKGKNWNIFGKAPSGLLNAGANTESSIESLTTVEQPVEMIRVPPTGQYANATKDFLRGMASNVANRLLYTFKGTQDSQWPMLRSDAQAIFAEVMRRLPPIQTNDVYIKYRTGYEAVCEVNHHQWVDKDHARDAAIYLMILVEQLSPDSK